MAYISFYHGRNKIDEDMDDWGFEGPIVRPCNVQWTYGFIKFFEEYDMHHVEVTSDLIPIDGKYYGDFNVVEEDEDTEDWLEIQREEGRDRLSLEEFIKLNK